MNHTNNTTIAQPAYITELRNLRGGRLTKVNGITTSLAPLATAVVLAFGSTGAMAQYVTTDQSGTSPGAGAMTNGDQNVAIGDNSFAEKQSTAIGTDSYANRLSVAIGKNARAQDSAYSVSIGHDSKVSNSDYGISLGSNARVEQAVGGIAIGREARVEELSEYAIALGANTLVNDISSNSIGIGREVRIENSVGALSLGSNSKATSSDGGIAVGRESGVANSNNAIAIGNRSNIASSEGAIAIGSDINVSNMSNSVTIGNGSTAGNNTANAYLTAARNTGYGAFSVGGSGNERQIKNVAPGFDDTDAVNVEQLKAVSSAGLTTSSATGGTATNGGAFVNATIANGAGVYRLATAYGESSVAGADGATAFGTGAKTNTFGSSAIGAGASAGTTQATPTTAEINAQPFSTAVGYAATANGARATAVGGDALATWESAALGYKSKATSRGVAVGAYTESLGDQSVAIGTGGSAASGVTGGTGGVAIGASTSVTSNYGVGIGYDATSSATNATAIGTSAVASGIFSTAIGPNAKANDNSAVALGSSAEARSVGTISIGTSAGTIVSGSPTVNSYSVAIGHQSGTDVDGTGNYAIGFRTGTKVVGANNVAMGGSAGSEIGAAGNAATSNVAIGNGAGSKLLGSQNVALGFVAGNNITGGGNIAIGSEANTAGGTFNSAIAIGTLSVASATDTTSIGRGATAAQTGAVALGQGSITAAVFNTTNANVMGTNTATFAGSAATSTVSVGRATAGGERTITNVAAGRLTATSTDAVNGSQLLGVANVIDSKMDAQGAVIASALGGGSTYTAATNVLTAPTFTHVNANNLTGIGGTTSNVASAIDRLDTALGNVATNVGTTANIAYELSRYTTTIDGYNPGEAGFVNPENGGELGSTALGAAAAAHHGQMNTAIGSSAYAAEGNNNTALGAQSSTKDVANGGVPANDSTAIGAFSKAWGAESTAIGYYAAALGERSTAIGVKSEVRQDDVLTGKPLVGGTSIGHGAIVEHSNAVSIGTFSTSAVNTEKAFLVERLNPGFGAVSVGGVDAGTGEIVTRQIKFVAPGFEKTDAVNVEQLSVVYDQSVAAANLANTALSTANNVGSSTAAALGGGSNYNGTVTAPNFLPNLANATTIAGLTGAPAAAGVTTVANGFGRVDAALGALNTTNIAQTAAITALASGSGATTPFTLNAPTGGTTIQLSTASAAVTTLNLANGANAITVTGVKDGAAANDAVNFSQLSTTNTNVATAQTKADTAFNNAATAQATADGTKTFLVGAGTYAAPTAGSFVAQTNTVNTAVNNATTGLAATNVIANTAATAAAKANTSLVKTATVLGTTIDPTTGAMTDPSYAHSKANTITGQTGNSTTVQGAVTRIDDALGQLNTNIATLSSGTGATTPFTVVGTTIELSASGKPATALNLAGNAGAITVTGVKDGAAANDAVNFSQLSTTNTNVATAQTKADTAFNNAATAQATADGTKTFLVGAGTYAAPAAGSFVEQTNTVNTAVNNATTGLAATNVIANRANDNLAKTTAALGGGASYTPSTGAWTAPSYSVTNAAGVTGTVNNVGDALSTLNAVNNAQNAAITNLGNGTSGVFVKDSVTGNAVLNSTLIANTAAVDMGGRSVVNVKAGVANTDAVNFGQLTAAANTAEAAKDALGAATATKLGGGTTYDAASNTFSTTAYNLTNASNNGAAYNDVGTALVALDSKNAAQDTKISNLINGTGGAGVFTVNGSAIEVGTAGAATTSVNLGNRTVTGVKAGALSGSSLDAVNGSQLFATNTGVSNVVNQLGGTYNTTTGAITNMPTYTVGGTTYTTITGAVGAVSTTINNLTAAAGPTVNGGAANSPFTTNGSSITVGQSGSTATTVNFTNGAGNAMRVTGVANGTVASGSTDAVNGGQLFTALGGLQSQISTAASGSPYSVSNGVIVVNPGLTGAAAPTKIDNGGLEVTNIKASTLASGGTSAATSGQLFQTNQDLSNYKTSNDARISDLANSVGTLSGTVADNAKKAAAGTAMAIATVQAVNAAPAPGKVQIGVGLGTQDGQSALAFGINGTSESGRYGFSGSVSAGTSKAKVGAGVGVRFVFD